MDSQETKLRKTMLNNRKRITKIKIHQMDQSVGNAFESSSVRSRLGDFKNKKQIESNRFKQRNQNIARLQHEISKSADQSKLEDHRPQVRHYTSQ